MAGKRYTLNFSYNDAQFTNKDFSYWLGEVNRIYGNVPYLLWVTPPQFRRLHEVLGGDHVVWADSSTSTKATMHYLSPFGAIEIKTGQKSTNLKDHMKKHLGIK